MKVLVFLVSILAVIVSGLFTAHAQCNVPPALWCSSEQTAASCQVTEQCRESVWASAGVSHPVSVELYYESLCPGCRYFINYQLWPVYQELGIQVINITLVPYGNAGEKWLEDVGKWNFTCQHGPIECLGNIIETCAIALTDDIDTYFPFIHCIENSTNKPDVTSEKCAAKHNIPWHSVSSCAEGALGNKLEHYMALRTEGLQPPHRYTPWLVINGHHDETMQRQAQMDLKALVCSLYQGPQPEACKKHPATTTCKRNI